MKKTFIYFLIFVLFLNGCIDPAPYYFKKSEYINEIERIELVKYDNDSYKNVDSSEVTLKFDPSKIKKTETLDKGKISDFLSDFEKIIFHVDDLSVNEPTGYCLLWYLKNGNFIVFSCTVIKGDKGYSMASEFDSTYRFVRHYADFAAKPHYDMVLSEYFLNYNVDDTE